LVRPVLFGLLCAISLIVAYTLAGSPGDLWLERDTPRFSKVTWLVFVSRGLAVGASSVVAGAVTGTPGEFELGLKIGLIAGTLSGVMAALGPLVEWWGGQSFSAAARGVWDDSAPCRFLSAIGSVHPTAVQCCDSLGLKLSTAGVYLSKRVDLDWHFGVDLSAFVKAAAEVDW
jgi:hypothetical protein